MIGLEKSERPFIVNMQDSLMKATIEYIFTSWFLSIATAIATQSKIVYWTLVYTSFYHKCFTQNCLINP